MAFRAFTIKHLMYLALIVQIMNVANADSEQARKFYKCYGLFVRERVPANHALLLDVENKRKTAADACIELLSKADLNSVGELSDKSDEAKKILATFLDYFNAQMAQPSYTAHLGDGNVYFNPDVIDVNETTYHFLYALFGKNQSYSSVVTRDHSFSAIRESNHKSLRRSVVSTYIFQVPDLLKRNASGSLVSMGLSGDKLAETGRLIGLKKDTRSANAALHAFEAIYGTTGVIVSSESNIYQHYGSGAIGTQSYLLANLGGRGFKNDGVLKLYRSLGKNVLQDFLCSSIPSLQDEDIKTGPGGWLQSGRSAAYRAQVSCMKCHASMDFLASGARNLLEGYTHPVKTTEIRRVKFVGRLPQSTSTQGIAPLVSEPDSAFSARPPSGRLYYRSFANALVDASFTGLAELGEKLANTDDLYVCAAKRQFKFLTGIDVDIRPDANSDELSSEVINLGQMLKSQQSLKAVIKAIIASDNF